MSDNETVQDPVQAFSVSVLGDRNFPLVTTRVTHEQGELRKLGDLRKLLGEAKKLNPEITLQGLVQAIVRAGVHAVTQQVKSGKATGALGEFIKSRR